MKSRLSAGDLYQRITIEAPTVSFDAAGQPQCAWATLAAALPAQMDSVTGGESLRGRQVAATATAVFTIRFRADVTVAMRVRFENRILHLVRVGDPYGDRRELRLECREAVS